MSEFDFEYPKYQPKSLDDHIHDIAQIINSRDNYVSIDTSNSYMKAARHIASIKNPVMRKRIQDHFFFMVRVEEARVSFKPYLERENITDYIHETLVWNESIRKDIDQIVERLIEMIDEDGIAIIQDMKKIKEDLKLRSASDYVNKMMLESALNVFVLTLGLSDAVMLQFYNSRLELHVYDPLRVLTP